MKKKFLLLIPILALTLAGLFFGLTRAKRPASALGGDFSLIYAGKPWEFKAHAKPLNLLYVGYVKCPDVCPMTLAYAGQAFRKLDEPKQVNAVQLLFLSVDAAHDTPQEVADYAHAFFPAFVGLTGSRTEIDRTVHIFGVNYLVEPAPKSHLGYSIAHPDRILFLDQNGYVIDSLSHPTAAEEILAKIQEHL